MIESLIIKLRNLTIAFIILAFVIFLLKEEQNAGGIVGKTGLNELRQSALGKETYKNFLP